MKKLLILATMMTSPLVLAKDPRIRINVLDTGITVEGAKKFHKALCKDGHSKNAIHQQARHGTNIVSIIAKKLNTKKYCIEIHRIMGEDTTLNDEKKALVQSYDAKYVNMSFNGPGVYRFEKIMIRNLLKKKVHIFVAAGNANENLDTDPSYPAAYNMKSKYWHVVGSSTPTWYGRKFSNYGSKVTETQPGTKIGWPSMTGTSQATPNALNKFIRGIK